MKASPVELPQNVSSWHTLIRRQSFKIISSTRALTWCLEIFGLQTSAQRYLSKEKVCVRVRGGIERERARGRKSERGGKRARGRERARERERERERGKTFN